MGVNPYCVTGVQETILSVPPAERETHRGRCQIRNWEGGVALIRRPLPLPPKMATKGLSPKNRIRVSPMASPDNPSCSPYSDPDCSFEPPGSVSVSGREVAGLSTSLDALRNKERSLRPDRAQTWWHRSDRWTWLRTMIALGNSSDPADWRRHDRLRDCGRYMHAAATTDGEARLVIGPCRNRACPTCARHTSQRAAARIEELMQVIDCPRMLTLTIRSGDTPLAEQLKHLWESFRRLRQTRLWRDTQRGAIAVIECTLNLKTRQWHPHLHVILDGDYVPQPVWSTTWTTASGGSPVVDIRLIRSRKAAATYVASYLTKHSSTTRWTDDEVLTFIQAFHGKRTWNTSGSLRNRKCLEVHEKAKIEGGVVLIGTNQLQALSTYRHDLTEPIYTRIWKLGGMWAMVHDVDSTDSPTLTDDERTIILRELVPLMTHAATVWHHICESGFRPRPAPKQERPPEPTLFPATDATRREQPGTLA